MVESSEQAFAGYFELILMFLGSTVLWEVIIITMDEMRKQM